MVEKAPHLPLSLARSGSGARKGGRRLNRLQPDPPEKPTAGGSQKQEHNTQVLKIQTIPSHTHLKISSQQAGGGPSRDSGVTVPLSSPDRQGICPPISHPASLCRIPRLGTEGTDPAFAYASPAPHGTCPSEAAKDWLGDSCEKGAAREGKQTFIICLSIYSPGGCNTRPSAANALVTLCCSDKLAKQALFCVRKQRPVSTVDQGFSAFIFNYYFLTQRI